MIYGIAIAFGLALGSFANVVIDRVPSAESIRGRSRCERCRRTLSWWELVPVVSALVLRHCCRTCHGKIPLRLLSVEVATAMLLVALVARHGGFTLAFVLETWALVGLLILAVIDGQEQIVPDQVSIPLIVGAAAMSVAMGRGFAVLGTMAAGAGFFIIQRLLSRGAWVGDGDVRVGALLGALLLPAHLAVALFVTYVIGGGYATVLLVSGRASRGAHVPLVPFLALGALVGVFFGDAMLRWYGLMI
jgi:prepilin signal peptidase PulO-like enzyme (type II secretory pathway)